MEKLASIIAKLVQRGARPVTVTMRTIPRLRGGKKAIAELGNPYKISVVNGIINFDYQKSVNRQLGREEKPQDFKVRANFFNHTDTPAIVCHRDDSTKLYLQMKVERAIESSYFNEAGEPISNDTMLPYLNYHSAPRNQGTSKAIKTIVISFENITCLVCDGQRFWTSRNETFDQFFYRTGEESVQRRLRSAENDSNSTYCEDCECRITAGMCKHGVTPPTFKPLSYGSPHDRARRLSSLT